MKEEYLSSLEYWILNQKLDTYATQALESILPNREDLNQNFYTQKPAMIVVRLAKDGHAQNFKDEIINIFEKYNIQPFEIILYDEKSKLIENQLSPKAQNIKFFKNNIKSSIHELDNIPCMVIVLEKLRMGERIPNTCTFFDVRSRYSCEEISNKSTFIQDIGRCAGFIHNFFEIFSS